MESARIGQNVETGMMSFLYRFCLYSFSLNARQKLRNRIPLNMLLEINPDTHKVSPTFIYIIAYIPMPIRNFVLPYIR